MISFLNQIDTELFLFLNSLNNSYFDLFFLWVTEKYSWIPLYLLILFLVIWRYMQVQITAPGGLKTITIKIAGGNWSWLLVVFFFIFLVVLLNDQISVQLFKEVFQRLRPSHEPEFAEIIHLPRRKGGLYGFVSGHAAGSFSVAYFTSAIIGLKWFKPIIYTWAFLFSYSRIYIGVHYPGDSIFGAILGIFIAWMLLRAFKEVGKEWFPSLIPNSL